MFGPSVSVHITPFMQGRGKPAASGPLDGGGRRSIYLEIRRNFLAPMMLAFDAPIPFTANGRRNESNVPAQALILLNDPFVLEQAKIWGKSVLGQGKSFDESIREIYFQALHRHPTDSELSLAERFFESQGAEYKLSTEQSFQDERVWGDFCHVMFNVKEFIYLN